MSIFRNALFMYRGLSEFSKGGYEKAAKTFAPQDLEVDLTGKSYIVTGTWVSGQAVKRPLRFSQITGYMRR